MSSSELSSREIKYVGSSSFVAYSLVLSVSLLHVTVTNQGLRQSNGGVSGATAREVQQKGSYQAREANLLMGMQ